ncbi:MAG TPA: NYN domain-containing protein [Bacillota bacterium]|nr:NYN domain-containing protein [Bacillota bacterium]
MTPSSTLPDNKNGPTGAKNTGKLSVNGIVLIDYENISELLRLYGKDPLELDFFGVMQQRLKESGLSIIDWIVYSNFEKRTMPNKQQTLLRSMGFQTRQASANGKNSGDLELTVEALRILYRNPSVQVFVIVSSDRDIIPLLKAIKYEGKGSYLISTRTGFNRIVAEYADLHEYVEEIFGIHTPARVENPPVIFEETIETGEFTEERVERAREVARHLYHSHIWKRSAETEEPVSLIGYINVVARIINRLPGEILNDFKVAHQLKLVTIYQDQEQRLFLREGEERERIDS